MVLQTSSVDSISGRTRVEEYYTYVYILKVSCCIGPTPPPLSLLFIFFALADNFALNKMWGLHVSPKSTFPFHQEMIDITSNELYRYLFLMQNCCFIFPLLGHIFRGVIYVRISRKKKPPPPSLGGGDIS